MQAGGLEARSSRALTSSKVIKTLVTGECECRVSTTCLPGPRGGGARPVCLALGAPPCLYPHPAGVGRRLEGHGDPREGDHSFPSSLGPSAHQLCDRGQQINLSEPIF